MKFLELTEESKKSKVLIPFEKICSISEQNGHCFVELGVDDNGESIGFFTVETFEEILKMITVKPKTPNLE